MIFFRFHFWARSRKPVSLEFNLYAIAYMTFWLFKQEHDVLLTFLQRLYDVTTLHGRCNNVKMTSCSCWVSSVLSTSQYDPNCIIQGYAILRALLRMELFDNDIIKFIIGKNVFSDKKNCYTIRDPFNFYKENKSN